MVILIGAVTYVIPEAGADTFFSGTTAIFYLEPEVEAPEVSKFRIPAFMISIRKERGVGPWAVHLAVR